MNWNPKINPMMQVRTNPRDMQLDDEAGVYTIKSKIVAEVANALDSEIVNAIVRAAQEAGVTDLILIDKEFILSAIQHEMERRGLR